MTRILRLIRNKRLELFVFLIIPFLIVLPQCINETIFIGIDGVTFFSTKKFYTDTLLAGDFAFWNKYMMAGTPFELWGSILYPPAFIFSFLPMNVYIVVYYCLHIGFGATFCYLFLREIKCSRSSAIIVAILYECSIHLGGCRKDHMTIVTAVVYLPFILYFIQKFIDDRKKQWLLMAALGMSMQIWAGVFQQALYTDLAVFVYLLVWCIKDRIKIKEIIKSMSLWIGAYFGFSSLYLIPTLALMQQFSSGGATGNTFTNFKSYSIHFYKLLQMIFPNIFGDNIFFSFGIENSSEMDIEIYLGVLVLLVVIFVLFEYRKDFLVKLSFGIMVGSFLYAAIGHLPGISYLIYNIPILGSFRVPSRALFIFIFFCFVLLGIGLSRIETEKEFMKVYKCIKIECIVILGLTALCIILSYIFRDVMQRELMIQNYELYFRKAFLIPTIIVIITWIIMFVLDKKTKKAITRYRILISMVLITTLLETLPYSMMSNSSLKNVLTAKDTQTLFLQENIENYKVWDAFAGIDGGHVSAISQNKNVNYHIAAINAYVPFNNPSIYRLFTNGESGRLNYSGLLTGSLYARTNLILQNDMLSMLGIKYIIDSSQILTQDNSIVDRTNCGIEILSEETTVIPGGMEDFYVYGKEIALESNTNYKISLEVVSEETEEVIVDFYGGVNYDGPNQNVFLQSDADRTKYVFVVNSEDVSFAEKPIYFRIIAKPSSEITISHIKIEMLEDSSDVYIKVDDGEIAIYENPNVNDILFVPEGVQQVTDSEVFFNEFLSYDLDDIAYVEEELNYSINQEDFEISDINFTNNQITAHITAKSNGFIMFSQCYYPGWRVYVNGERTNLYKVSETIMGAELPAGEYDIQFVYVPIYLIIGAVITAITCIFSLIYIIVSNRKDKKDRGEGNVG